MTTSTDATGVLAEHVLGLSRTTIPADVLRHAAVVLADTVGVLLAASREDAVQAAVATYPLGSGGCTVVGVGHGASADHAALINGIGGHDIELDDVHTSSRTHPACVIIPAALAAAELRGQCSGADVLAAIVGGFDVEVRVSKAMGVQPPVDRGFHLSGVAGAIGAAAAAGRLLDLSTSEMRSAIALGAAQSSGLLTFEEDPSHMLKSFNTGAAARSGVCAAQLAAHGYRGSPDVLAGRHNVLTPYGTDDPDYSQLTDALGDRFEISFTSLKRHACCSQTHAAIDVLLALQVEHGFTWKDIERIDVQLAYDALAMIDNNTLWTHNIQYVMAAAARFGWIGREHFSDKWTSDPEIAALARRVTLRGSDELQGRFPALQGAIVHVVIRDGGDHMVAKRAPIGTPEEPMSGAALQDKFMGLARTVVDGSGAQALWEQLRAFEDLVDTSTFFQLIAGPGRPSGVVAQKTPGDQLADR